MTGDNQNRSAKVPTTSKKTKGLSPPWPDPDSTRAWDRILGRSTNREEFNKIFFEILKQAQERRAFQSEDIKTFEELLRTEEDYDLAVSAHAFFIWASSRKAKEDYILLCLRLARSGKIGEALYLCAIASGSAINQNSKRPIYNIQSIQGSLLSIDEAEELSRAVASEIDSYIKAAHPETSTRKGKVIFISRQFSPLPSNTGTKLFTDYAIELTQAEPDLQIEYIPFYDHVAGTGCPAAGTYLANPIDFSLLFERSGHYRVNPGRQSSIALDDRLRTSSTKDYNSQIVKRLSESGLTLISIDFHPSPVFNMLHKRNALIYVQPINRSRPMYPADTGVFIGKEPGNKTGKNAVDEWTRIPFLYDVPRDLKRSESNTKMIITVAKDLDLRLGRTGVKQFSDTISLILQKNPSAKWTIVGSTKTEFLASLNKDTPGLIERVQIIEYEPDLLSLLAAHSIFVLPQIPGGGRVAAWAAMAKMPLVVFEGSDAEPFVPDEGIVHSYEKLETLVDRLLNDEYYYEKRRLFADAYFSQAERDRTVWLMKSLLTRAATLAQSKLNSIKEP
jgi:hypothetical protein